MRHVMSIEVYELYRFFRRALQDVLLVSVLYYKFMFCSVYTYIVLLKMLG